MNAGMKIRRRYPRMASQNPALVKKLSAGSPEGFARTNAISVGGCGLATDEPFGAGEGVELLISVRGHVITAFGRIVYEKARIDGMNDLGVEFLWLSDEDLGVLRSLFDARCSVFPEV